jgi:tetratricopeptide (TPR) repeat protein
MARRQANGASARGASRRALLRLGVMSIALGIGYWGVQHNPVLEERRLKSLPLDRLLRECNGRTQDPLLLYYAGLRLDQAGRYGEAAGMLGRAAELDPASPRARDEWARALVGSGRPTAAYEELGQFVRAFPDSAAAHLLYGRFFFSENSNRRAAEELTRATQLQPNNGEAWSLLAVAREALADPSGTLLAAERAAALRPSSAPDHLLLATVYARAGRNPEARREFERAGQLAPASAPVHREYATWLLAHAANPETGAAVSLALREAQAAVALDANDARAQLALGQALERGGELREAATALIRAAQLAPDDPQPARELRALYREQGNGVEAELWRREYLARQSYFMARRRCLEQIEVHPEQEAPHRQLAHLLASHGDVTESVRQVAAALRCTPDAPPALMATARDLLACGYAERALPLAQQAVERSGADLADADELLGDVLLALDRSHAAAAAYQAAADARPERLNLLHARLAAYFTRRNARREAAQRAYAEATGIERVQIGPKRITPRVEALAQRAVALAPDNPLYLRYLLHIQTARRYHDQAIQTARRLLALQPEDTVGRLTLAILLLESATRPEELAEAESYLRRADTPQQQATLHYGLGLLALKRRDAAAAVRELEQAVRQDPTSELGYYKLAQAQTLAGDAQAAQRALAEHARLQSQQSRQSDLLGNIATHPNVPAGYRLAIAYFREQGLNPQAEAIRTEARRRFGATWRE